MRFSPCIAGNADHVEFFQSMADVIGPEKIGDLHIVVNEYEYRWFQALADRDVVDLRKSQRI
jgi:hypothetical protein